MRIIRRALIAVAVGLAVQANAAQYNVTGNLDATKVVGATATPSLTLNPASPAFSGIWDIDTATGTLLGGFDFDPYTVDIKVSVFITLTGQVTQSNAVYRFDGGAGNASYNAATHTLTMGQELNYTSASGNSPVKLLWNGSADPGHGLTAGTAGVCTGSSTICNGQDQIFLANPDLERFYLSLTFDGLTQGDGINIFSHFTGTAVSVDVGGSVSLGNTGNSWTRYTFTGSLVPEEVPVPAAAWLLGSGLAGLAGVARRKRVRE